VGAGSRRDAPREILLVALLSLAVGIAFGVLSPGTYQDDDLDHYYVARHAWAEPGLFLDRWAMPLTTLVFASPARLFGFAGVEVTTALCTALTALLVGLTARRLRIPRPWTASVLFAAQPLVVQLSHSALAEPVGALVLALALWAWYGRSPGLALAAAGWLPLARIEGGVILLGFLAVGWGRVSWRARVLAVAPLVVWNLLGWMASGDPMFVVHGGSGRPLNSLGVWQYARNWIVAAGPVVWFFFAAALAGWSASRSPARPDRPAGPNPRPTVVPPSVPAPRFPLLAAAVTVGDLLLLTLLAWDALPFGRSIGFLRHVLVVAPAAAVTAAWGVDDWLGAPGRRFPRVVFLLLWPALAAVWHAHVLIAHTLIGPGRNEWRWMAAAGLSAAGLWFLIRDAGPATRRAATLGVVLLAVAFPAATVRPEGLDGERKTVSEAVKYLRTNGILDRRVFTNHVWFVFLAHRDRYDLRRTPRLTLSGLEDAQSGDIVIWENHYGARLYGDVPLERLQSDPRFQRIFEAYSDPGREFHLVAFLRL